MLADRSRTSIANSETRQCLSAGSRAQGIRCNPMHRTPDPLHAIDEPAARTATRIHALPHISTAQHTDRNEATRCSVWRCEALLLADCWQVEAYALSVIGSVGVCRASSTSGALLSSDDLGSSVEQRRSVIRYGKCMCGCRAP